MVKVSIGMPVYNGEKYIEKAIQSILSQTYNNIELIISDNASTDRTREICCYYRRSDKRVRYVRNDKNFGARFNYNKVFNLARGEFFKWASHDDICMPTYIEKCLNVLIEKPKVALAYPKTLIIDEFENVVQVYHDNLHLPIKKPSARFKRCLFRKSGECNAVFGLIRSSILKRTRLIGNYNGSDYILLANIALLGEIYEIPEVLFCRRDHAETSGRANPLPEQVANWFDPLKEKKFVFTSWRWLIEYIKLLKNFTNYRAELIFCLLLIGRWGFKRRRHLINEIIAILPSFRK